MSGAPPRRVLAICTTAIGDTLMCTPVLADLARCFLVDVLVHSRCAPLLERNPHLRRVFKYRNNPLTGLLLALRLRPTRYHRLLILHANRGILRLVRRLRWDGAAGVQGFDDAGLGIQDFPRDPGQHFVAQRLALSRWAGAPGREGPLELHLSEAERERAAAWLAAKGLAGAPVVALCPGAALDYKRWPVERFAALARELAAAGCGVLVVGAPGEMDLYKRIAQDAPGTAPALGLGLRHAAALLAKARLLITNDTGPMHLAMAVGTRVLALFGPSSPAAVGPREPGHKVLQVALNCEPCRTKACHDPVCFERLETSEVLANALAMLAES